MQRGRGRIIVMHRSTPEHERLNMISISRSFRRALMLVQVMSALSWGKQDSDTLISPWRLRGMRSVFFCGKRRSVYCVTMWYCAAHAVLIGNSLTPQKVHKTPWFLWGNLTPPLPHHHHHHLSSSSSFPSEEQQKKKKTLKHFLNPAEDHALLLNMVPVDKQWIFP